VLTYQEKLPTTTMNLWLQTNKFLDKRIFLFEKMCITIHN